MDKLGTDWKECLKISKIVKFESDLLKTNKDKAPQSRAILFCKFLQLCGAISLLT